MNVMKKLSFIVLLVALLFGGLSRFSNLGDRPLAEDEYYTVMGVKGILDSGLPAYKTGGYYTRFLGLQYLEAGVAYLLGDNEFSHRLPAVVFGFLTIPLFYIYARPHVGILLAASGAFIIAVSAWEIEFSRFARMYTLFQFLTVLFFYFYHAIYVEGKRRWQPYLWGVAIALVATHALGLLLLPFVLMPLFGTIEEESGLIANVRRVLTQKLVLLGTAVCLSLAVLYNKIAGKISSRGVYSKLPEGYEGFDKTTLGRNAEFPFYDPSFFPHSPFLFFSALCLLIVGVLIIVYRNKLIDVVLPAGVCVMVLSSLFHFFSITAFVFLVLVLRFGLLHAVKKNAFARFGLGLTFVIVFSWFAYALHDLTWTHEISDARPAKAIRLAFFGFPDFYTTSIMVWKQSVPISAFLMFVSVFALIIRDRRMDLVKASAQPWFLVLYMMLVFGVFNSVSVTTRYWFFAYPMLVLSFLLALKFVIDWVVARFSYSKGSEPFIAAAALCLFVVSDDFHAKQLLSPIDPDVTFRMEEYAPFEKHWYPRFDERTPAGLLNQHREKVDAIVLDGRMSSIDFYLDPELEYFWYLDRDQSVLRGERFSYRSRKQGTVELWTNRPLLDTKEEFQDAMAEFDSLLIARWVGEEHKPNLLAWLGDVSVTRLGTGIDERIEVLLVRRK